MSKIDRISYDRGISELVRYFQKPENHLDWDKLHVSRDELKTAVGKISAEADKLIEAVLSNGNYELLASLQKEGRCNDYRNVPRVSLRDLYAARRGTGYDGEDISEALDRFKDEVVDEEISEMDRLAKLEVGYAGSPEFDLVKMAIESGQVSLENLLPWALNRSGHVVELRKAALEQIKNRLDEDFANKLAKLDVGYEGCAEFDLVMIAIKSGKVSLENLQLWAKSTTGHHAKLREAALEQISRSRQE